MEKINLRTVSEILSESEMKQTGGIARGCFSITCEGDDIVSYVSECDTKIANLWCEGVGEGECNPCIF